MISWINFLHLHQPPLQDPRVLDRVVDESYKEILNLILKFPKIKLTLNISGSLLEQLQEDRHQAFLEDLRKIIKTGQIELTGSAMYHPILPLIPEKEVVHQIQVNTEKIREIFGADLTLSGFFLPEMAYSDEVADIVKNQGFSWLILDEIHLPEGHSDNSKIYKTENGLNVIFRSRKLSKSFPPESILKNFEKFNGGRLITAHDGEMYGHWHKDTGGFIEKIFSNNEINTLTVSEHINSLKEIKETHLRPASWETLPEELNRSPYIIWNDPKNKIHQEMWNFSNWVYGQLDNLKDDENWRWAKLHYDRGISSCFWWWASGKKLDAFSPISWNPTEIEKGAKELIKAVRSFHSMRLKTRLLAEKKFRKLIKLIWEEHWCVFSLSKK